MIGYLHIRDFAIIDELEVELGEGFNVITGETGAGKSILVQGLSLLRGGRATARLVRAGADSALVEAVIEPHRCPAVDALFAQVGLEPCDELVLTRVISPKGRGRVRINGELSTVGVLGTLVAGLVDLTGQHDQQSLAVAANHREILDGYGVKKELLGAYRQAHSTLGKVCRELDGLALDPADRATREDILAHQVGELKSARVGVGEEDRLEAERRKLASVADLAEIAHRGVETLYAGNDSVTDTLARLGRELEHWLEVEAQLGDFAARLHEARALCEDVALELRAYGDTLDADPHRLEKIEERLLSLAALKRKHRCVTVEQLLERQAELERELADLQAHEQRFGELERRLKTARQDTFNAARALRTARKKAARKLEREVEGVLADLGMRQTAFKIAVEESAPRADDDSRFVIHDQRLGATGMDRVEMQVAANPGQPLLPVRQVASGGELSRILLALKTAIARTDTVSSYIFDEVDAGIGGTVGDVVGAKLAQVAAHRQVICVTHLPQIAAQAAHHFVVEKQTATGKVRSTIRPLGAQERVEGLARMMSGARKVSKKARAHATELLQRKDGKRA